MSKKFIKNKEDFICQNCGAEVSGTGFTNHCYKCLWSKHVDINPGDREERCGGMMQPVSVEQKNGEYRILHRCQKCGIEKVNKVSSNDEFEEVLKVAKRGDNW